MLPPESSAFRGQRRLSDVNEPDIPAVASKASSRISCRTLLLGAGAAIGTAGIAAAVSSKSNAQEPQQGTGPATPNPLSATPVPQVITEFATDWPVAQGNLQSTRQANSSSINSGNLDQLATAWTVPITVPGNFGGMTATPVIIDNVVYLQDMQSNVVAFDLGTGKEIWRADYSDPSNGPNGVAVSYDMVFAATGDTSVAFALDIKTGKEIWSAKLSNNDFECIDMAPAVYDNTVYVSTNPNNTTNGNYRGGARGIVYALDAATGKTLWSFDTATDNLWGAPRLNSG